MLIEGTFEARGVSFMETESPEKKTPFVAITLRFEGGPNDGQLCEYNGYYTDATKVRTAEALRFCGYDFNDPATISKNRVLVVIEHETFTGKDGKPRTAAKVKWINEIGGGRASLQPLDPVKKQSMMADLRALAMSQQQAKPAAQAPAQKPSNAGAVKF